MPNGNHRGPVVNGFVRVERETLTDPNLSASEFRLLLCLQSHLMNGDRECWPSEPRLAEMSHISIRQVRRLLRSLEGKGLIKCHPGIGRRSSTYLVTGHPCPVRADTDVRSERTPMSGQTGHPCHPEEEEGNKDPSTNSGGEGLPLLQNQHWSPGGDRSAFQRFWKAYPKKVAKKEAMRAFKTLAPSPGLLERMLEAVTRFRATDQWQRGFVPHPATWLRGRRWEDEVETPPDDWKARFLAMEGK